MADPSILLEEIFVISHFRTSLSDLGSSGSTPSSLSPIVDMVESVALVANVMTNSDDSDVEGIQSLDVRSPLVDSQIRDIFKAANQLSQLYKIDVVAEQKKNKFF